MQNQNDYDRINKYMIAPLCQLFKFAKIEDEFVAGFVEELSEFSDETLKKAFKQLRRERKSMPSIAHAYEACKDQVTFKETGQITQHNTFHCVKMAEVFHPQKAKEILSSRAGQLALSLGVAHDLLSEYECTGRMDFDESFVRRMAKSHQSNCQALVKMPLDNPFSQCVNSLYEAVMERERRLFTEFASRELIA